MTIPETNFILELEKYAKEQRKHDARWAAVVNYHSQLLAEGKYAYTLPDYRPFPEVVKAIYYTLPMELQDTRLLNF